MFVNTYFILHNVAAAARLDRCAWLVKLHVVKNIQNETNEVL